MNHFDQAVKISNKIVAEQKTKISYQYWKDSPLYEIKTLSSGTKGAFGEKVVKNILLCHNYEYDVIQRTSSKSDLVIKNKGKTISVEIKTSFLWLTAKDPFFKFQQVRISENDDYDLLLCLGITKNELKLFPFTKKDCKINNKNYSVEFMVENNIINDQHSVENCWFTVKDSNTQTFLFPKWHSTGNIKEALDFINEYFDHIK